MSDKRTDLPDEEVSVKLLLCGKCSGIIRTAVVHMMDLKMRNSFAREAMQGNLLVKEQSLLEYREADAPWCNCKR